MGRTFTAGEIIARARRYADMENSAFIGADEALDYFNAGYSELYDALVMADEDYFTATMTFAISNASDSYPLPDDFYKISGVDFQNTPTSWSTLQPFTNMERNSYGVSGTIPSGTIRLKYTPFCPIVIDEATLIDGINGFEDYIAWFMAVRMLAKEESSTTVAERQLDRFLKRIEALAPNRDLSMPSKIQDIYKRDYGFNAQQVRYKLYGDNITFIATTIVTTDIF